MKSNVLLTGYSGFIGSYLYQQLSDSNHNTFTLGRSDINISNHTYFEVNDTEIHLPDIEYDKVIHSMGLAHSIDSDKELFNLVNVRSTKLLTRALGNLTNAPKEFIYISSVAVYGAEAGEMIAELTDKNPMNEYGKSKLASENHLIDWCSINNVKLIIFRLPLVVGSNPKGNLKKIAKAIKSGHYLKIKNNHAKKSAVLLSDVSDIVLSENLVTGCYNLTDGYHPTFSEIEDAISTRFHTKIRVVVPFYVLMFIAKFIDTLSKVTSIKMPFSSTTLKKMSSTLTFDDSKATDALNWAPSSVLEFLKDEFRHTT